MRKHTPCRVCGETHSNPMSSSVCPDCGKKEAANRAMEELRQDKRDSAFQSFMALSDEDKWRFVFEHINR